MQIGDLVRVKTSEQGVKGNVFLVLEKRPTRRTMALCMQGSKKVWLYIDSLEKL